MDRMSFKEGALLGWTGRGRSLGLSADLMDGFNHDRNSGAENLSKLFGFLKRALQTARADTPPPACRIDATPASRAAVMIPGAQAGRIGLPRLCSVL